MVTPKQEAAELLERLPDDVSMDDLLIEFHVLASIRRGLEDVEHGRVLTQEEVRRRLSRLLESSGQKRPSRT
jgi:hypothetical protein